METVDVEVLRKAQEWVALGQHAVLGTLVRTWGSAPRPVGALVAIRADGQIAGSVSGGCIEDDLIDKVRSGALPLAKPQRMQYGISAAEANRFGLPCGGTLEIVLEMLDGNSRIGELLDRVAQGRRTVRRLDLATGTVTLADCAPGTNFALDDAALASVHGPAWRLLVIGAGQMSRYLAQMALALDYEVLICDPRAEYADAWAVPGTTLMRSMPDDTVTQLGPDAHTAIVALTHDPKLDDLALLEALRSRAFYVGAIGSGRNQEKRKERLREFGISTAELERLHGPVGLKNGARTPPEIAVAILAELTACKYGYRIPAPIAPGA